MEFQGVELLERVIGWLVEDPAYRLGEHANNMQKNLDGLAGLVELS